MRSSSNNHRLCRVLFPTIDNEGDLHSMAQSVSVSGQFTILLLSPPIIEDFDAYGCSWTIPGPTPGSTHGRKRIDLSWNNTSAIRCWRRMVISAMSRHQGRSVELSLNCLGQVRSGIPTPPSPLAASELTLPVPYLRSSKPSHQHRLVTRRHSFSLHATRT